MVDADSNTLKKLGLEILLEFHNFCVEHKLKYSLFYGSLLGAIRHKGFIPWDDDIDIGMPRNDYLFLINNFDTDNYGVCCLKTNRYCYLPWAKVYDKRTKEITPQIYIKEKGKVGYGIDIFPLDYVKDFEEYWNIKNKEIKYIKKYYKTTRIDYGSTIFRKYVRKVIYSYYRMLRHHLINKLDYFFVKHHSKNEDNYYAANAIFFYNKTYLFDKKLFDNLLLVPFENHYFYITDKWDEVLTSCYGDYMTLPKEKDRTTHHQMKVMVKEIYNNS